jgi:hypothetical protein
MRGGFKLEVTKSLLSYLKLLQIYFRFYPINISEFYLIF